MEDFCALGTNGRGHYPLLVSQAKRAAISFFLPLLVVFDLFSWGNPVWSSLLVVTTPFFDVQHTSFSQALCRPTAPCREANSAPFRFSFPTYGRPVVYRSLCAKHFFEDVLSAVFKLPSWHLRRPLEFRVESTEFFTTTFFFSRDVQLSHLGTPLFYRIERVDQRSCSFPLRALSFLTPFSCLLLRFSSLPLLFDLPERYDSSVRWACLRLF